MNQAKSFNWLGWSSFASLLLFWELGARATPKLALYFPPVSRILGALGQALAAGSITQHALATLARFAEGFLLAALLAVLAGVVLGYFRCFHSLLATMIELLRPMPSVAIIPVAILLLGIGDAMIVSVTVYA
ncbi:MAG: ABC transporter permease, partial [Candidatus Binatota bacterium]|nr:ABC transporter permease [Candidatus Binatota bacterium]